MSVSFVVRLVPGLHVGQFLGDVVEVVSGELAPIHDVEELVDFIAGFLAPPTKRDGARHPGIQPPAQPRHLQEIA